MSFRPSLSLVAVLGLAACTNLGIGGAPDELTIDLESVGTSRVTLVTSTQWFYERDPACDPTVPGGCPEVLRVLGADSTTVDTPHRQTYRFGSDHKYLVEAFPAGGVTATVQMKIEIDGKEWFYEARELKPDGATGQETLQFVYQWQEPTLR
jgi:hypothetical protein